jgi:hypothetical protein
MLGIGLAVALVLIFVGDLNAPSSRRAEAQWPPGG